MFCSKFDTNVDPIPGTICFIISQTFLHMILKSSTLFYLSIVFFGGVSLSMLMIFPVWVLHYASNMPKLIGSVVTAMT